MLFCGLFAYHHLDVGNPFREVRMLMSEDYQSRIKKRKGEKASQRNKKAVLFKKVLLYSLALMLLIILAGGIWIFSIIKNAPELSASKLQTPFSSQIYDKDGELITTLFMEQNRIKVNMQDVPDKMKRAVISIEDRRFYQHNGIDIKRIIGALVANIEEGWGSEGGSTITQQVVKRTVLSPEKTLSRKIKEAYLAIQLENRYSKNQILQMYLNNIYYGNGAYGLATASKTYFGTKDLSQLNVSQMALLAGLPNAPSYYDPFEYPERAAERRSDVLNAMVVTRTITEEQAAKAESIPVKQLVMKQKKINQNNQDRPYKAFIDQVYHELVVEQKVISDEQFYQGGLKIYTTLDADVQEKVYRLLKTDKISYPDKQFEVGIALIDTQTGAIRAVGGGRDFLAIGDTNYGAQEKSPPGSTFKPIIDYGPAIEYLNWSTAHTLIDEPYSYSDGTPIHEWDGEYWGEMTMRRALAWSRNIPALKTFQAVGKENAAAFAGSLGIKLEKPIFEPAAIGGLSSGVTPLQLASAYAAFGNGGIYHQPYTVMKIVFQNGNKKKVQHESARAMHDYTAYMITDMLKTAMDSGTGTAADIPGVPVAGKTGSTNIPEHLRDKYKIDDGLLDSWFVGYTTQYSTAIWTGYPKFKEGNNVHYIHYDGSEDIAKEIFQQLMGNLSSPDTPDFEKPDSVIASGNALYVRDAQQVNSRSNGKEKEPENNGTVHKKSDPSVEQREQGELKDQEEQKKDVSVQDRQNDNVNQKKHNQPKKQKEESEKDHLEDQKSQSTEKHPTDQENSNKKTQDQGMDEEQNNEQSNDQQKDKGKKEENPTPESDGDDNSDTDENTDENTGQDNNNGDEDIQDDDGENIEDNTEEN